MSEIKLNDVVVDKITGFTGVVVAITEWANGCRRAGILQSNTKGDGSQPDETWIDTAQLMTIEQMEYLEKVKEEDAKRESSGGGKNPLKFRDPSR